MDKTSIELWKHRVLYWLWWRQDEEKDDVKEMHEEDESDSGI